MTFLAVSCYDDRALREDIEELEDEVAGLAERMDSLEKNLNVDVESINKLEALLKDFDGTLAKALEKNLTEVEAAFEEKLAELEEKLAAAIAEGDQASADALAAEKKTLEDAMAALETTLNGKLEEGLATVTTSLEELRATVTSLETLLGQKYDEILAKMDTADGLLDGKITDLNAALEQVKKDYAAADSAVSAELAAEIAEVIAKIAVTDVKEDGEKVVLTLATGETIELSKTPAVSNEGLVTIVTDESGARFWAVVVNGEPENLGIMVGSDVQLEFRVVDNYLEFTTNGTDWMQTGAYVADDAEYLKFYQGETGDYVYDENWNMVPVLEDYYTFVYGGTEYYLPIYRADNSSVTIRAGKTYFAYGESKTIDVAVNDVTAMYVMTKPDGWKAVLNGKKLTVTAPAEANVTSGVAEADGEVLLHCSTLEGKCKVARLAVATTEGFSLTVDAEGNVKIVNPVVVTTTDMWGNENTDFNDAYVGLAPIADFEADPVTYVNNIQDNYDALFYYLNNWKMNTAETDDVNWNTIYTIGGAYVPGEYEVDVIETTVAKMYSDWTWGQEMPRGSQFVVWAAPMDDKGMPKTESMVYGYYTPIDVEAIAVGDSLFNDVTISLSLYGASSYIVGKVAKEYTMNYNTGEYDLDYFISNGLNGLAYGYNNLGMTVTESGTAEYNLSEIVNDMEEVAKLTPNTEYWFYVIPVIAGKDWSEYTAADAIVYEYKTTALTAGGTAAVVFSVNELGYTEMAIDITGSEGTTMIYYNFYDPAAYYEIEDVAADLIANGFVTNDMSTTARKTYLEQNQDMKLAAIAVDAQGKYGDVFDDTFTTKKLVYSETFTATVGEPVFVENGANWNVTMPVTVEGGEAAEYYYYWNTRARTEEQLNTLPLMDYYYYFNAEALPELVFYSSSESYQFAVVVKSTTGEYSAPKIVTVAKPVSEVTFTATIESQN